MKNNNIVLRNDKQWLTSVLNRFEFIFGDFSHLSYDNKLQKKKEINNYN